MKNSKKVEVLKSEQRGYADHGWLKSFHSFSFANYYNPDQMGSAVNKITLQIYSLKKTIAYRRYFML